MRIKYNEKYTTTTFGPAGQGTVWRIINVSCSITGTSTANSSFVLVIARESGLNETLVNISTSSTTTSVQNYLDTLSAPNNGQVLYRPIELVPGDNIILTITNNGSVSYVIEVEEIIDGEVS